MVWASAVEHCAADLNEHLFVFAYESAGQGLVLQFDDYAIAEPLPELRLGRPELILVTAENAGRAFLLFLLLKFAHGEPLLSYSGKPSSACVQAQAATDGTDDPEGKPQKREAA